VSRDRGKGEGISIILLSIWKRQTFSVREELGKKKTKTKSDDHTKKKYEEGSAAGGGPEYKHNFGKNCGLGGGLWWLGGGGGGGKKNTEHRESCCRIGEFGVLWESEVKGKQGGSKPLPDAGKAKLYSPASQFSRFRKGSENRRPATPGKVLRPLGARGKEFQWGDRDDHAGS